MYVCMYVYIYIYIYTCIHKKGLCVAERAPLPGALRAAPELPDPRPAQLGHTIYTIGIIKPYVRLMY